MTKDRSAYYAEWVKANPEKIRLIQARWQKNNPESHRKRQAKWALAHPDKARAAKNKWNRENPQKCVIMTQRRRALIAGADGDGWTVEQELQICEEYGHRCAYCNQIKPLQIDHVIPLSRGGRHDIDNIVPACKSCNSSKGNKPLLVWMYKKLQVET